MWSLNPITQNSCWIYYVLCGAKRLNSALYNLKNSNILFKSSVSFPFLSLPPSAWTGFVQTHAIRDSVYCPYGVTWSAHILHLTCRLLRIKQKHLFIYLSITWRFVLVKNVCVEGIGGITINTQRIIIWQHSRLQ